MGGSETKQQPNKGICEAYSDMSKVKIWLTIGIVGFVLFANTAFTIAFGIITLRQPSDKLNVFENAMRSVVELKAQNESGPASFGSAVLVSNDGCFITSAHVIVSTQGGTPIFFEQYAVRFTFENDFRAVQLVDYDLSLDIATLKLQSAISFNLAPLKIAPSGSVKAGQEVFAIGNGINHGIGLTKGCISIPRLNIEYAGKTRTVIQCDLTVNEGNSGGALLDNKGNVIGLTAFRLRDSLGTPIYGIAFCIPLDELLKFIP